MIWRDFHIRNFAERPVYTMQKINSKTITYAILTRPWHAPYFFFSQIIADIKRRSQEEELEFQKHREREAMENEQALKDMKKIEFFEKNVSNTELIIKNNGHLGIESGEIGTISINEKAKTIKIEIKQIAIKCIREDGAIYQVPIYGTGHLLCENAEYKIIESKYGDAVYMTDDKNNPERLTAYGKKITLCEDAKNPERLSLTIINNLLGIKIICDKISVADFNKVKIDDIERYKELENGISYGKFFSIQYD